tara:strand:- start:9204 stop:9545 length:342 start_codon:yes stop_codon:yes gene_type:complete
MYAVAAGGLITATYLLPKHFEVTPRYLGSFSSNVKNVGYLSSLKPMAPEDLVPVGGDASLEIATAALAREDSKQSGADSPTKGEEEIKIPASAPSPAATIRAKPIVTDAISSR